MKLMNCIQEVATSSLPLQSMEIRSFIPSDLETMELEEMARSAGYTEDEICEMLGKPLKELPLSVSDIDKFVYEFEDVPY